MDLKPDDIVFFHCGGETTLYCRVSSVRENEMNFEVINGGYTLTISKVEVPLEVSGNYNKAMDWFNRKFLGLGKEEIAT